MIRDLIGDSTARGQYAHRGMTQSKSMATTTSRETPEEQESADSLGSIISKVTPLSASGSGGLAAIAASATGAFTQILSNPELNTSVTSASRPSANRATSPMEIDTIPSALPLSEHDSISAPPSLSACSSGLARPLPSQSGTVSATSSGARKRKREPVETEDIKSTTSRRSKREKDSKPAASLAAFVGMTGAVSGLTTSLNQSSSLSDTSVVQQAMSLISTKADYLSIGDKGLLFQYYARNPTAAAGLLALDDMNLQISLTSCAELLNSGKLSL